MELKNNTAAPPVILCGFMSCGKTTVGRPLARRLGYEFVDTDEMLVETYEMTIPEMFKKGGESYFRDLEHQIAKRVCSMPRTVVSTGGGMMTFPRNGEILSKHGIVIYLERDFEECYSRLVLEKDRPLVKSRTKEELRQMYEGRTLFYKRYSDFTVRNDGTAQEAVERIAQVVAG